MVKLWNHNHVHQQHFWIKKLLAFKEWNSNDLISDLVCLYIVEGVIFSWSPQWCPVCVCACVRACVCVCGCNPPFPSSIPLPTSSPSPSLVQNWKGWFSLESQISVEDTWLWSSSRRGSQKGNRVNDKLRGWAVWTDVGWTGLWLLVRAGSGRQCS